MNKEQLQNELDAVYASTSWKVTAPLRYCMAVLKREPGRPRARDVAKRWLARAVVSDAGQAVKRTLLANFPSLLPRAHRLALWLGLVQPVEQVQPVEPVQPPAPEIDAAEREDLLPPAAREILGELRRAMRADTNQ